MSPRQLILHLLSRGLLSSQDVIAGRVKVVERSRRNRNFQVAVGRAKGYFVKQARLRTTLDVEAEIYRCVRERPLARHLPLLRDYDRRRGVLALQLVTRGDDLGDLLIRRGRISRRVAAELGRAVAAIHQSTARLLLPPTIPWVLSLPRPPTEFVSDLSAGNIELLRIVQQSTPLCRELTRLSRAWRGRSLVHNDLRLDNFVLSRQKVRIVDWELAGWGEPAWDVGCLLAEFLTHWIRSIEFVPGRTPGQMVGGARLPLMRLQPAIGSFWLAYRSARLLANPGEFFIRAVRFAGARMIQRASEHMDGSQCLTPRAVALLQLSENVITHPADAATTLFGISTARHG